jgi:hypothetical protein
MGCATEKLGSPDSGCVLQSGPLAGGLDELEIGENVTQSKSYDVFFVETEGRSCL